MPKTARTFNKQLSDCRILGGVDARGNRRGDEAGPLRALFDRAEVQETVNRVALLSDARDWGALRSLFADEVGVDHAPLDGGEQEEMEADDLVEAWRAALSGYDATQHVISNHVVTVHERCGRAACSAYVQAHHYLLNYEGSDRWTLGGRQDYDLIRISRGWKIRTFHLIVLWATGNRHLPELARRRFEEGLNEKIGPR